MPRGPLLSPKTKLPSPIPAAVRSVQLTQFRDCPLWCLNRFTADDFTGGAYALTDLCQKLVNLGVMPYYLHQLDRVNGAAHFEAPAATGLQLIEELTKRLPGYAVPKFVQELPGQPSKSAIRM